MKLIRALVKHDTRCTLSVGVKMYAMSHDQLSTNDLADFFDVDVVNVTRVIGELSRNGWLVRVDSITTHSINHNVKTGRMIKTSATYGVYEATDKLKGLLSE